MSNFIEFAFFIIPKQIVIYILVWIFLVITYFFIMFFHCVLYFHAFYLKYFIFFCRPSNNIREKPKSIHSRLGTKYTRDDLCRLGSYGTSERNYSNPEDGDYDHSDNERSFPRRNENMQQNLDDDEEEESEDSGDDSYYSRHNRQNRKRKWSSENQIDLRTKLKKLRSGLVNKHRSPLCIDTESKLED